MLYISLVASAVLLVAVNAAARRPNRPVTATAAGGLLLFGPAPLVCLAILPTVVVQAALLCVVSPLWRRAGWGPGRFLALSAGATLAAYGLLVGLSVAPTQREYARLRERFPFESVEGRLPLLPARPADARHDPDRLAALEGRVDEEVRFDWRARELASLHERTVSQFVNSPGFGVARMSPGPTKESLTYGLRDGPAPPQPARPGASYWAPGPARPAPAETDRGKLLRLHDEGVLE